MGARGKDEVLPHPDGSILSGGTVLLLTTFKNLKLKGFALGGGMFPEGLSRGVQPASKSPYPIYDQNL